MSYLQQYIASSNEAATSLNCEAAHTYSMWAKCACHHPCSVFVSEALRCVADTVQQCFSIFLFFVIDPYLLEYYLYICDLYTKRVSFCYSFSPLRINFHPLGDNTVLTENTCGTGSSPDGHSPVNGQALVTCLKLFPTFPPGRRFLSMAESVEHSVLSALPFAAFPLSTWHVDVTLF